MVPYKSCIIIIIFIIIVIIIIIIIIIMTVQLKSDCDPLGSKWRCTMVERLRGRRHSLWWSRSPTWTTNYRPLTRPHTTSPLLRTDRWEPSWAPCAPQMLTSRRPSAASLTPFNRFIIIIVITIRNLYSAIMPLGGYRGVEVQPHNHYVSVIVNVDRVFM